MSFDFMYPLQPADLHQVSIPLEQGGVFRRNFRFDMDAVYVSFNPFGAGRSLSTGQYPADSCSGQVSIPL